jgi:hypothetical protein
MSYTHLEFGLQQCMPNGLDLQLLTAAGCRRTSSMLS